MEKMKMKKFLMLFVTIGVFLCMTLSACTTFQIQESQTSGTEMPPNMPNPASVYCEENGNKLEIQTAEDGSQSGLCVFPDGSECDEWAYFRGECKLGDSIKTTETVETPESTLQPGTEAVSDWWGTIKSTPAGAQYNDFFDRQDLGQAISYGIDSIDPAIQSQIEALRDSGKIVHLYGIISLDVPDYNGSQIQPDRIVVEE